MAGEHATCFRRLASRRFVAVAIVALGTFATAGVAKADGEPEPPVDSAVIQYVELVPTSEGAKAPGVGKKTKAATLPAKTRKALAKESPTTAKALATVATSSDYGAPAVTPAPARPTPRTRAAAKNKPAPQDTLAPSNQPSPAEEPSPTEEPSLERTVSATAAAVAPVDDGRLTGLLVAMLGIAVAGAVLAARRRS
jgi:hypothetical protein